MQDTRTDRSHIQALQEEGPVCFDIISSSKPEEGIALDSWYANHHLKRVGANRPSKLPRCYVAPASASYLHLTEDDRRPAPAACDSMSVAQDPVSLRERLRFLGRPLGTWQRRDVDRPIESPIVYPIFFSVPTQAQSDFDRWYDEEHVPLLLSHPAWGMCRRFALGEMHAEGDGIERPVDGGPGTALQWNRVALHYLSDLRALESPERDVARSTPWRSRLNQQAWFRYVGRIYYRVGIHDR